jgi:hypothetical protein
MSRRFRRTGKEGLFRERRAIFIGFASRGMEMPNQDDRFRQEGCPERLLPLEVGAQVAGNLILSISVLITDQFGKFAPHADLAVLHRKDAVNAGYGADIVEDRS